MSNKQHRHLALELDSRLGKVFRRLIIEVRYCLIQDQHLRAFEQGTGNGEALQLPTR